MKEIERKVGMTAISLDGIATTATWRVECEELIMEEAPNWLEDDHDIEATKEDVAGDFQFQTESGTGSVPPSEPKSKLEGDRPGGSVGSGRGVPSLPSSSTGHQFQSPSLVSRGHHFVESSLRGRQSPVRGPRTSREPTPSSRGQAISTTITFSRKRGRGNR